MKNVEEVKWVVLVMGSARARDELLIFPSTDETKRFKISDNDIEKIAILFGEYTTEFGRTFVKDNFLVSTNDEKDSKRYWIYAELPSKIKRAAGAMDSSKLYELLHNKVEGELDYSPRHLFDIVGIELEESEEKTEEVIENKMHTASSSQIDLSEQEKEMVSKKSVQNILDALMANSKERDELLHQLQSLLNK